MEPNLIRPVRAVTGNGRRVARLTGRLIALRSGVYCGIVRNT